jgi:multiple antibiotic resistance protein
MINGFLLAFPALVSIINPVAVAFIFRSATTERDPLEVQNIAFRVAIYSFIVMLVALLAGSHVLAFFGISLAALRIAGGLVVGLFAWDLLNTPENRHGRKEQQASVAAEKEDIAFFPLTIPVTTGPGTISVAVALSAGGSGAGRNAQLLFLSGLSLAALVTAVVIWLACRYADRLALLLGQSGSRVVTRLSAFLLLCIGVQIIITGFAEMLHPILAAHEPS